MKNGGEIMSVENEEMVQSRIPDSEKAGVAGPLFAVLGCNVAVTELMVGGGLISGLTMKQTIAATVIGNLILAFIAYFQGYIGMKEGLNTYVLTEMAFGKKGNKILVSSVMAITLFGWFGMQAGLATLSVQKIFPNITNYTITAIIVGIVMTYFAAKGFYAISWFNYIVIPPLFILILWGMIKTSNNYGLANIWTYIPKEPINLITGINMVVGLCMCGAIISCDYTRYCRKPKDVAIVSVVGFTLISLFQEIGGAIISITAPSWNIVDVLADLGFNWIAFIILIGAAWSSNLVSAYSGGMALKNIFSKYSRVHLTIIAGAIGTILAAFNIVQKFTSFLNLMSVVYGPIAGILWVEYYFVKKQKYIVDKEVNYPGIIMALIGAVVCYITSKNNFGISAVNGLLTSSILYFLYKKANINKNSFNKVEGSDVNG